MTQKVGGGGLMYTGANAHFIPVYHVEKLCPFFGPLTLYGHVTGFFKEHLHIA